MGARSARLLGRSWWATLLCCAGVGCVGHSHAALAATEQQRQHSIIGQRCCGMTCIEAEVQLAGTQYFMGYKVAQPKSKAPQPSSKGAISRKQSTNSSHGCTRWHQMQSMVMSFRAHGCQAGASWVPPAASPAHALCRMIPLARSASPAVDGPVWGVRGQLQHAIGGADGPHLGAAGAGAGAHSAPDL